MVTAARRWKRIEHPSTGGWTTVYNLPWQSHAVGHMQQEERANLWPVTTMQMHLIYAVSTERSQKDKNQQEIPSRYHSKPAQRIYGVGLWDSCYPGGGRRSQKAMRVLLSVGYTGMFSLLKIIKYLLGLVYFFICMLHFNKKIFKKTGTFLAVQWLRLRTSTVGGVGAIPGCGTKLSHTAWQKENSLAQNTLIIHITILFFKIHLRKAYFSK